VARKRRPAFLSGSACAVTVVLLGWLALGTVAQAAVQDEAKGYRLAGTLAVGQDHIAFLAVPQGGQVLVRAGSVVNGVQVVAVTAHEATLKFPSGTIELLLDGTNRPAAPVESSAILAKKDDPRNRVYDRQVSGDQVSRELAPAAIGVQGGAQSGTTVAAQRIAAVLDLPDGSTVRKVGPIPVTSAQGAIQQIEQAFESAAPVVILDIQTPKGPGRVYLHRDGD
jgi:hypothetical protein